MASDILGGELPPVKKQFICIKIGGEQYGIDISFIDNIVRMQQITRVPRVAKYIKGVMNVRGEVIPVLSLRLKMGLPQDEYTKKTRIIILKMGELGMVSFIVDEVKEVVSLDIKRIDKVSRENGRDDGAHFISGVGQYEGGLISILDLDSVVADKK